MNSDPRLRISRSSGGASEKCASTGVSAAGTLARTTEISGESPSAGAASTESGLDEDGRLGSIPSATKDTGLGNARSFAATSVSTADMSFGSGPPTGVATLIAETIAVACSASTPSRSAAPDLTARGDPRSSIGAARIFSLPAEPKPVNISQTARRTVRINAARAASP